MGGGCVAGMGSACSWGLALAHYMTIRSNRGGFTLIEAALATMIIGVGVVAIVEAQQAFMRSNAWSSLAATSTLLAGEIRELTRPLPRHDPVTGLFMGDDGGGGSVLVGWGPETGEIVVDDLDDIDDFDGIRFAADGDLPGPIDAFGNVIPELLADGSIMLDDEGDPVPLQGWSQTVYVEKIDPFDHTITESDDYYEPPSGDFAGRAVGDYPLRVTVVVEYQGLFAAESSEVTRVTWIVP